MARRRDQRGQAAVEAALTLPLMLFLMLGTLQLFLMFQARIAAEYAVFRAVRVGSTNSAQCRPMMDAAVVALLPTFKTYLRGAPAADLAAAFRKYGPASRYRYDDLVAKGTAVTQRLTGSILLMQRRFARAVAPATELEFDQPGPPQRLEVRLVFWYPMRIPFANWVISKMVLGYSAANPLMLTQKASWDASGGLNGYAPVVAARAAAGEYVLPVVAEYSMRMMSPVEDNAATCGAN